MLFALLGALMMAGGFGALSQRASYWLGVRIYFFRGWGRGGGGVGVEVKVKKKEKEELTFNFLSLKKRQVTAPASERARVAAGLFGGEDEGGEGGANGDEEGALRPKGAAAAMPRLSTSGPKAGTTGAPSASAANNSIHVSASTDGQQQQQHHEAPQSQPPPRRTGSGGRVRSFFTGRG